MSVEVALVVEDNKGFREAIVQYLAWQGVFSLTAADATDAARIVREEQVDFIVLDWQLPDKDGLTLIDELAAEGFNIPIIFMTAFGEEFSKPEFADRLHPKIIVHYITKGEEESEALQSGIIFGLNKVRHFIQEKQMINYVYYATIKFLGECKELKKLVETGKTSTSLKQKYVQQIGQATESYSIILYSFLTMSEFEQHGAVGEASVTREQIVRNILDQLQPLSFEEQYEILSSLAEHFQVNLDRAEEKGLIDPKQAISVFRQSLYEHLEQPTNKIKETQLLEERIDPAEIDAAFEKVIKATWPTYRGKTGRKPVRIQRIREGFRGRENEYVPLDDLAIAFEGKKNPRKYAASTISWLNKTFKELDINLEIKSTTVLYRGSDRPVSTRYRFHYTPPK